MVLVAVVQSELEEIGKIVDIMGEQDNVVCLANSSHLEVPNRNAETRVLGILQLLIVVDNIEVTGRDPALLEAKLIVYGTKNILVPFHECLSTFQPIIKVKESFTCGPDEIEFPDNNLSYCQVKS